MLLFQKRCCWFLLLMLMASNLYAAERPGTKAKPDTTVKQEPVIQFFPEPIVSSDSVNVTIPFNRAGNLIIIKAIADTTEGNFILDTGAPHLVLNMTYFRGYPSTAASQEDAGGITGGVSSVDPTSVKLFTFGGIRYYNIDADRINLGHLENSKGIKILGLLGLQLFKRFEMLIDYEKNLIHLHLINKKDPPGPYLDELKNSEAYNTLPIDIIENKLITYTQLQGRKLRFLIDTGAESNVLDSRLPNKIFENVTITGRVMLSGTGQKKVEALHGNLKNIQFGGIDMGKLPVIITNMEKMCFAYDRCLDGMLGFDFLSLHKIGFNFVKRKMYIWK